MNAQRIVRGIAIALCAVACASAAHAQGRSSRSASLATIEGVVTAVETRPGEGGGRLDVVRVTTDEAEPRTLDVALAPESTLRQIGFEVAPGDRLRARIFLSDDGTLLAHKVMNVTRGTMVRLRTLTRIPLWDGNGRWQGGPCRTQRGGPAPRGPRR